MEETISFTALWALLISINHTKGVNFPIKDSGTPCMCNQQVHKHIHTHSGQICFLNTNPKQRLFKINAEP